jgi:Fuc2NAc and GlcNAc transferase
MPFWKPFSVTLAVRMIKLYRLLPLAVAAICFSLDGTLGIVVAYVLLVVVAWAHHAGEREINGGIN